MQYRRHYAVVSSIEPNCVRALRRVLGIELIPSRASVGICRQRIGFVDFVNFIWRAVPRNLDRTLYGGGNAVEVQIRLPEIRRGNRQS